MVDVGGKQVTKRAAIARGFLRMRPETLARIDRSLVEPHFDALSARHVRWIMTLRAY